MFVWKSVAKPRKGVSHERASLPDSGPWIDLETGKRREISGTVKMPPESVIALRREE